MTAVNAFLDARSNACYKDSNVEQDHHFGRNDRGADHSSDESHGAIVHYLQRASTTSMQTGLLR
jgi:hypothetical protein